MEEKDSELIDAVIEHIKNDLKNNDITAIYELLWFVPTKNLIAYLPEEEWENYKSK